MQREPHVQRHHVQGLWNLVLLRHAHHHQVHEQGAVLRTRDDRASKADGWTDVEGVPWAGWPRPRRPASSVPRALSR